MKIVPHWSLGENEVLVMVPIKLYEEIKAMPCAKDAIELLAKIGSEHGFSLIPHDTAEKAAFNFFRNSGKRYKHE